MSTNTGFYLVKTHRNSFCQHPQESKAHRNPSRRNPQEAILSTPTGIKPVNTHRNPCSQHPYKSIVSNHSKPSGQQLQESILSTPTGTHLVNTHRNPSCEHPQESISSKPILLTTTYARIHILKKMNETLQRTSVHLCYVHGTNPGISILCEPIIQSSVL